MEIESNTITRAAELLQRLKEAISQAMVGQDAVIEQVLVALVASGHVLIEGVPGLGKTLLVRALNEAARRRVGAYSRLSASERIDAIAQLAGADAATLGPAVHHGGARRAHELRQAIALIESVRRRLLKEKNA